MASHNSRIAGERDSLAEEVGSSSQHMNSITTLHAALAGLDLNGAMRPTGMLPKCR